ncbi:MAG TPA: FAD/NAD(P)-binding oxidoreductase [Marmoricola sp.]|jgi:NADPH-dependent 2,4-dienoyl-CoA reductase/sulfur reductase-like enzyme|nr:FAD/NAD(P)-binding oxidoreductase [Marmoricola sp.]
MHVAIVGGSDAGIEAARRCLELDPQVQAACSWPTPSRTSASAAFPDHASGEVPDWRNLAHRTAADLEQLGITLLLDHAVTSIDASRRSPAFTHQERPGSLDYDRLILATDANPRRRPIAGLDTLGPQDAVTDTVNQLPAGSTVVIVGAGCVGLEMAEALTIRELQVVVVEQLPQVLPRRLDAELAASVESHFTEQGVQVRCNATVEAIEKGRKRARGRP